MSARVTGYAYPWDVRSGFTDRVADSGVDEVAVAVAYHSARAATPFDETRSAVLARHAALYRPAGAGWGRLRPAEPDWVGPDCAGEAVAELNRCGVAAAAWLVLTHNSLLGGRFPDVAVRNCFDEVYPWALCPSHAEVRDYAARLTEVGLGGLDVRSVVLEACGQLGAVHQHQHEKTDAVWSPVAARLLSVCCCPACARSWTGFDAEEVRELLRTEVRRTIASGDLTATTDDLPDELRAALLAGRHDAADLLRRAVLDAVGPGRRVLLHGSADVWATGALPGLTPSAASEVDGVVLPCWSSTGPEEVAAAGATAAREVGAYVTAVGPQAGDLADHVRRLRAAGASELHLYHLGLAGPARLPLLREAADEARRVF
ncbi:hypothetical protein EIL87_03005 [Saccharopolyspora rhizosphaerae]|uniref:Alanine-rich protein n=1 Tax=Saccharopolyspora rhizosphaerae TaxID=2492662 RepID=A0A3R8QFQ4_9PSEU|nr:hypothetical protein [Saccharopolyspora rhizosphaerae]RRO19963.1 hypothetical protein EIL87_03005 [Saccharopolyspora rhizosphaerae]